MKSDSKKMLFWCLFVTLIKIFPDLNLRFNINNYIFPVAVIISLCLIHFISKRIIGIISALVITIVLSIYDNAYFVYALPVILLYCSHTYAVSENKTTAKKNGRNLSSIIFSLLALLCLIPQFLYAQELKTNIDNNDSLGDLAYEFCYITLFLLLFVVSIRDKGGYKRKIKKEVALNFKLCNFSVVICICASIYNIFITTTSKTIVNAVELNYWFIFLVMVILNKDPYLDILVENFYLIATRETKNKVKK